MPARWKNGRASCGISTQPYRHPGRSLGTATQFGISIGVALAHRDQKRLVVDMQPDGDLMFDAGALWTVAKHRIPMLVVMYNNRAYYNDWEHQIRMAKVRGTPVERAYIGMDLDDPAPDFAAMARSMGWYAEGPFESPDGLPAALERAISKVKDRPAGAPRHRHAEAIKSRMKRKSPIPDPGPGSGDMTTAIKTVGVIGAGRMGLPLIGHMVRNGFAVSAYDIDATSREAVTKYGWTLGSDSSALARE